jgi:predicted heme/steroid binding protein
MKRSLAFSLFALLCLIVLSSKATEEYAKQTGKSCKHCHLDTSGGGELTKAGENFLENLLGETNEIGTETVQNGKKGILYYVRLLAGFIHFFTAIFWFGTILYVHIILKPAYAVQGLPREEVRLGLISMLVMGITGTILTLFRIPTFSVFYETRFGILLLIKIGLFLIMISTALFVVVVLGPKLKNRPYKVRAQPNRDISTEDLAQFNGTESRAAYVGYKGKLYDISQSEFWKDGIHFGRHKAGEDLTDMLNHAPHGEDKIFAVPMVGKILKSRTKKPSRPKKAFYFMAYLNLILVILIITILALWKWW